MSQIQSDPLIKQPYMRVAKFDKKDADRCDETIAYDM